MKGSSNKVRFFNWFRKIFQVPFLEEWLARHTRGKPPDHFICKLVPNVYQYPAPSNRTFLWDGIRLTVDISDYMGHYYYFGFQDKALEKLYALCDSHSVILDIGAHVGFTALKLALKAKSGYVIGFEPDPFNYSSCIRNIELNSFSNIKICHTGLGNEDAILPMEIRTAFNRGGNRINESVTNGYGVPIRKLDGIMESLKVMRVDLIKIDVEGYELEVLRGAEQVLKEFKPILFIELSNSNLIDQGDSAQELLLFLSQLGYKDFTRAETSEALGWDTDFSNCHFDIIVR